MKKKIFVNANHNTHTFGNIHLNDNVIVVDGSYMINVRTGKDECGIDFIDKNGNHELFTVIMVNVPVRTGDTVLHDVLRPQNNCQITSNDGTVYNCSAINIKRYEGPVVETVVKCECCGQVVK